MKPRFNSMKIAIIGSGNVARAFVPQLKKVGIEITGIWSNTSQHAQEFAEQFQLNAVAQISDLTCDLALICVSENALNDVVNEASQYFPCAVSSGTFFVPKSSKHPVGIFYPLQTFSKQLTVALEQVPFFVTANALSLQEQLLNLGNQIGKGAHVLSDEQRQHLHIAAIFANNFTNHLLYLSEQYAQEHDLDPKWLRPLMEQTFTKLQSMSTEDAQTGPARRGSEATLKNHSAQLEEPYRKIYETLSNSILNTYKHDEKL